MKQRTRHIVAANVKRLREERNLSVIDAAERLGVLRQYWYLIEKGGGNLPLDKLEKVAEILGVTVTDLLQTPRAEPRKKRKDAVGAETC